MPEIDMTTDDFGLGGKVQCVRARWWRGESKCVVVDFEETGSYLAKNNKFSFRLDLDKVVFLDHISDSTIDSVVHSKVEPIWQKIMNWKLNTRSPRDVAIP